MQDLLPGQTIVVARGPSRPPQASYWTVDGPLLIFDERTQSKVALVASRMSRSLSTWIEPRKRFLKRHGIEVVLGEYLDFSLRWLELCRELGVRFYAHAHGYDVSQQLLRPEWREAYRRYNEADGVVTVSGLSRQRLIEVGLDPLKLHTIPCGVDVPVEPSLVRRRERDDIIRCLAVGRFVTKKAPIYTLEAFRQAANKVPTLRLDYVGDGELWPAARQFVQGLGLASRITLHRAQSAASVAALLADADIFLLHGITDPDTGDEEGLPVALLEAMAQSLPVVSTRHGGIPEAVLEGVTGYLVGEGDVAAMAERIVELGRNEELRRSLGRTGWRVAKESFSWEREQSSLLAVLGLD
jgi:colanic acid/amylovoran biosynthesis glycosyltransferase